MSVEELQYLFGAMTIINLGVLIIVALCVVILNNWISGLHSKMFNISREEVSKTYFKYIASYKVLWIFFNLVPYIAFCYMG